jgi:hypothetical protein
MCLAASQPTSCPPTFTCAVPDFRSDVADPLEGEIVTAALIREARSVDVYADGSVAHLPDSPWSGSSPVLPTSPGTPCTGTEAIQHILPTTERHGVMQLVGPPRSAPLVGLPVGLCTAQELAAAKKHLGCRRPRRSAVALCNTRAVQQSGTALLKCERHAAPQCAVAQRPRHCQPSPWRAVRAVALALALLQPSAGAARAADLRWSHDDDDAPTATDQRGRLRTLAGNVSAVAQPRQAAADAHAPLEPAPDRACSAQPQLAHLAALAAVAGDAPRALLVSTGEYFRSLVLPRVAAGCSLVSLTRALGHVPADPGAFPAPAARARAPGPLRIAKLLVSSDAAALQRALNASALHVATHWAYAEKNGYDLLLYAHLAPAPKRASPGFIKFVVKAAGVLRALFVLDYDYAMLTGAQPQLCGALCACLCVAQLGSGAGVAVPQTHHVSTAGWLDRLWKCESHGTA